MVIMIQFSLLVLCSILIDINGLNCRTEGSLKSDELKTIFNNCLRQHEGNNSSNKNTSEDWGDNSDRSENDGDRKRNREQVRNWMEDRSDRSVYERGDRQNSQDSDMNGRNQENGKSYQNGRRNRERMDSDHKIDGETRTNGNNYQNDNYDRQNTYQGSGYGSESQRNMYSYPNQRYKRSQKNSGQRSQYNPNPSRADDNYRDKDSNQSSKEGKACAMHCFLDNLHMTGENGMPDRYLVTNAITKDVRNEDLRDFLQESIEECFQILDNDNTEDKCEFSKNLLICLSEKGRATCDDWKDDVQFT